MSGALAIAPETERRAAPEGKSHHRSHCAGDGSGRAHHRQQFTEMRDEMNRGAGGSGHHHEGEKPHGSEALRHRRTKGEQPDAVQQQMSEAAVQQCVGDECPDIGRQSPRPSQIGQHARVITRGNEGKQQQKLGHLFRGKREREHRVDEHQYREQRDHGAGHIEHSFAARLIEHGADDPGRSHSPPRRSGQAAQPLLPHHALAMRDKPDHDDAVSHLQTIIAEYKLR